MAESKYSLLTMFGHICTDINQGALPAVLPFLVLEKNISYTSAAALIFAANSMSSIIQPLFGYLGDKVSWPWLMGLGAFLAGAGMALIGFQEHYWGIFLAVMLSGIGIALFHPEGGKTANLVAGEKKGTGIGIFAVGGNIGFALGPIIASTAITIWGIKGTAVFLIPAVAMALLVIGCLKDLRRVTSEARAAVVTAADFSGRDDWASFIKVAVSVTCRSVVSYGMTTFIPLYFSAVFLLSEVAASARLTLFSFAGAAATLLGGHLADRWGFRRVIKGLLILLVPLLFLFPLVTNPQLATFLLLPIAFTLSGPHGSMIAWGQKFTPNHIGTSSGIMYGLTVSIGGMLAPCIGWVADTCDLTAAMYAVAVFSLPALIPVFCISSSHEK